MQAILVFVFVFVLYILGVSHSVFGGDNGDIILAAWFGGVAHPPGYPLNSLIGWIFTHLPYHATVAFKANIMAAFLQAAGIAITFLVLKKITNNFFASLASSLTLAFTTLYWLYAHTLEVFQLTYVLVATAVYFLINFYLESTKKGKNISKNLLLAVLFFGIATFHHHVVVLLAPAVMYLIYKKDQNILSDRFVLLKLFVVFCIGITPYVFSIWAAFRKTPVNWDDPSNIEGFVRLITRADYGTFTNSQGAVQASATSWFYQSLSYLGILKADFTYLGIIFVLIGATFMFSRMKALFIFVALACLLTGSVFLSYAGFSLRSDFVFGIVERFVLISYLFIAIFLAYGYLVVLEFIKKHLKNIKFILSESSLKLLFNLLLILIPFSMFFLNYARADLSSFKLGDELGLDVLGSTNNKSILFLFDDTVAFNTLYVYHAGDSFKDRKLVLGGSLKHPYYRRQVVREYPDLKYDDTFLSDKKNVAPEVYIRSLIQNNTDFEIYSIGTSVKIENKKWITWGLPLKLIDENEEIKADELMNVYSRFRYQGNDIGFLHLIPSQILSIYSGSYLSSAYSLLEMQKNIEALELFNKAGEIYPESESVLSGQIMALVALNQCTDAKTKTFFEKNKLIGILGLKSLEEYYTKCEKDAEKSEIYKKRREDISNLSGS